MNFKLSESDKQKIKSFVFTGIIVLTLMVMVVFGVKYVPKVVTVTTSANGVELPIYSVHMKDKKVALSFEVGEDNKGTEEILDVLKQYGYKATFFIHGSWFDKYQDTAKRIIQEGHDLGNHSENHKHMSELEKEQVKYEIIELHESVKEKLGFEMKLFRVPYGDFDNTVIRMAKEAGYYPILWNIDSRDWKDYGTNSIVDSVLQNDNFTSGSIVRFHTDSKFTVEALSFVIDGIIEEGYDIVAVSKLIHNSDYYVDASGRQMER